MAAGPASPTDRPPVVGPTSVPLQPPPMLVSDAFAKDAILAWYRGEFAAANAIIDALCAHLAQFSSAADYSSVFAAIHRRRLHWIPVLQMQKYHSIADVTLQLQKVQKVAENKIIAEETNENEIVDVNGKEVVEADEQKIDEKVIKGDGNGGDEHEEYDSPESEITDSGKNN